MLCRKANSQSGFNYLRIPVSFLIEKTDELHVRPDNGKMSLFISAEKDNAFTELRGRGKVDFSRFLVVVRDPGTLTQLPATFFLPLPIFPFLFSGFRSFFGRPPGQRVHPLADVAFELADEA